MADNKSPYDLFGTDKKVEKRGITIDFGSFVFHIARAGGSNHKYGKMLMKAMKPHRKALSAGTMDPKEQDRVMAEVYADTIILGWTGVTDKAGKELAFTRENCIKLLSDLPELFKTLVMEAENFRNFKEVEIEEIAKN